MIPILYDKNEIAFVSNGLDRLVDCVSCEVTEERNGVYECEFVYPMTGRFYQEMVDNGGIISVIHDDAKDRQAFDIYKYSAPIDGLVTFNARHISYRLSGIPVRPFTAASCALALQGIKDNSVMPNPFTFWTDKVVSSTFTLDVPASARALLAGQQGSILDVYGKGEYKYNNFDVRLYVNRGVDSGVEIRYGKNLSNMTRENDKGDLYNAIVPYWKGESGVVTVPGYIVTAAGQTSQKCVPMDFSGEFSEEPTATQLQAAAENYLAENEPWAAFDNITVDFVQLWETEDYKDVAVLERCSLCDTVSVYFPALGVTNTHAKIVKVTYDVLRERYSSMELGSPQTTLSQAVLAPYQEAIDSIDEKASVSFLESAIQAATDLITGGLGGHVVIGRNAD
jgi:phage minor structural protein